MVEPKDIAAEALIEHGDSKFENQRFPRPVRERPWFRFLSVAVALLFFGAIRLPIEVRLNEEYRNAFFHGAKLNLSLRQQIGQTGFLAALGGFRALVADGLWIQAHIDWTRTEWGKMLFLFNNVTALQPRNIMFWDTAAWHMAWNASAYVRDDPTERHIALRLKRQHEYFLIGKDLLERGIQNNPDRYKLYESLANLLRDKLQDHYNASIQFAKAAKFADAPTYEERFSAYELSYTPGHQREAYNQLLRLYRIGQKEWLPTLLSRLKYLQENLNIPPAQRINIPNNLLPPHH
jgi:hypothetical protein